MKTERIHNRCGIAALITVVCLCAFTSARGEDDADKLAREYQVKAAYLYNFVKYVTWPDGYAVEKLHEANICIAGENPFDGSLILFKQASSTQLALNVKLNVPNSALSGCHILFISRSEKSRLSSLLAFARSYPLLTVSEINGFSDSGGVIEMVKAQSNIGLFSKDKINLRINLRRAEAEGLHIDAHLLEIAAEVIK